MAGPDLDWANPAIINNQIVANPPDKIVVTLGPGDPPEAGKDKAKK